MLTSSDDKLSDVLSDSGASLISISAYGIYVLLVTILWAFFKKVRGKSFDELFKLSALAHHQILELHRKHPHGGTWKEFNQWLAMERALDDL